MIEAKQEPLPNSAFDYSHYMRDPAGMIMEKKRKDGAWNCVCATTPRLWIDDVSFSNSLTIEHNTLGGGSIGHILRHTETNSSSYAQSHRWFHYDQVGSVMAESDASGALAQTHYQDAFGNTQEFPRLEEFVADGGYRGEEVALCAYIRHQRDMRIAARRDDQKGFEVQPVRWIVERTFAWLSRCRRLVRDYEKTVSSAKGFIHFAMIRLMARRLAA